MVRSADTYRASLGPGRPHYNNDRALAVIARLRGGTAGQFAMMKFNEMEDDDDDTVDLRNTTIY